MKKRSLSALSSFLLIWVVFTASARAGQVVTDEVKSWAKGAIEQEKALDTVRAPNTVAVLYFSNKTGLSDLDILQKGLTLMLITDLSKIEEIQLVERVKIQAVVEELDLGVSGLVDPETSSQMGELLGVERLVGGEIIRAGTDQFALASNILKVPTEKVFGDAMTEGELLVELFRMEKDLLFQIIEELQIELSVELRAELEEFMTTDLSALLYLFEAIEQADLGNYEKAAESCEKALSEDLGFSYADDLLSELEDLDLWPREPEAYSKPEAYSGLERVISIPETNDRERMDDDKDPPERENSPSVKVVKYGSIDLSWDFASNDVITEETGLPRAIEMAVDPEGKEVFLAYAVQAEEDRVKSRIFEMHRDAVRDQIRLDTINTALEHAEMRIRDDWFTRNADAQAGRVLKDKDGNQVRIQQYILRPDDRTVQVLNVCLRGGSGDLAGLSTMNFTTEFKGALSADCNLRSLPWNEWLNTQTDQGGDRYVYSPEYSGREQVNPELDSMYVRFTNPGDESLKESRGFDVRENGLQRISGQQLTINNSENSYDVTPGDSPVSAQYAVVPNAGTSGNPGGFDYVLGDGNRIGVTFHVLGDGDRDDNQGVSEDDYSSMGFNDIWDALRVNEGHDIGTNNLEISIDGGKDFFARPIDVVYIPMSRMLWNNNES